jgi:hypothetical protein
MSTDVALVEPGPHMPAARLDSWVTVLGDVARLADTVAQTDFVPRSLRGNAAAITAAILYGREIGLPPMQALRWVNVIDGRPALAAESQRALVLAAGHELVFVVSTSVRCVVRGRRAGAAQWHEVEWTIETARQANLLAGGPRSAWHKYPRSMLKARASAELCRDVFPDVTGGFAAVEEFDVMPEDGPSRPVEALEPATGTVRRGRPRKAASEPPGKNSAAEEGLAAPEHLEPITGTLPAVEDAGSVQVPSPNPAPSPSRPPSVARAHRDMPPAEPPGEHAGWADVPLPGVLDEGADTASDEQGRMVFRLLGILGVTVREERLNVARAVLLRRVESFGELSKSDASRLIDTLAILAAGEEEQAGKGRAQLDAIVRHWLDTEPMPPEPPFDTVTGEVFGDGE